MAKRYQLQGDGVAVITGASSGMGVEFAMALAKRGYDVVLVARREERLRSVARHLEAATHRKAHVLAQDLSKEKAAHAVHKFTKSEGLDVAVVVNNAGFGYDGAFTDMTQKALTEMIHVNVTTLSLMCRLYLPDLIARGGGGIINVSSIAGFFSFPRHTAYAASKGYVNSFTQALAIEAEEEGVHVQAVCPGPTETEFSEVAGAMYPGASMIMMSARDCVRHALNGFDKGEHQTVPGVWNDALSRVRRVVPEDVVARVTHFFLKNLTKQEE